MLDMPRHKEHSERQAQTSSPSGKGQGSDQEEAMAKTYAVTLTREERAHVMIALRMWRSFLQGQDSPQGLRYLKGANELIRKLEQDGEEARQEG